MRLCTTPPLAVLLLSGLSAGLPLRAQEAAPVRGSDPPVAAVTQTAEAPVIDGRLDEASWMEAQVLSDFVQREPMEGRPISERTEVRILADAEALYVGGWMFDRNPARIVLGETRRDAALNNSDAFLFVLDTYLDRQNGFVFGTTPAGIEYDGQIANEGQGGGGGGGRQQRGSGGGFNLNWDGSWEVATSQDANGWYAEFRIPFSTLRYPSSGEQSWGLNFARNIRRNNEESVWAPIPRQFNLYRVSLAGTLEGLRAPARRIATVTPYVLGEAFRDFTTSATTDYDPVVGADAKLGLTQSLTMDLTINTDFAQAEVDDQQVNLTRFPLFFPEKRAFFLENAGTFAVGSPRSVDLFFSRRIGLASGSEVPLRAGARISGKAGGLQVGFLNIQAGHLDAFDETAQAVVRTEAPQNYGVGRVFKEFANRTRLGGIVVSRINTDDTADRNLTFGLDGRLGIGDALTFDGWVATTNTPGVSGGEYAFNGGGRYETRDWQVSAGYRQVGDSFNPEVGFLSRREYRHFNTRILRHIRVDDVSWFREFRPHVSWNQYWALDGFSESYLIHIDNHFAFANGAFFQLPGFNFTGEGLREPFAIRENIVIPAGTYHNIDWEFRANTDLSAPVSLRGGWGLGGFYSGHRFAPTGTLTFRFQDRLVTSLRVNYFDVRLEEGSFTTSVAALSGTYSFSPNVYLRASLQYNDDTENFGSNVQFGWLDTAGTGLFIVFNDTEHYGSLQRTGLERGPLARQFIIKYTKLFDIAG